MSDDIIKQSEEAMQAPIEVLRKDLEGIKAGRANVAILNPISVKAYGTSMPINQLASISAQDSRTLMIQVWDKENVSLIQKAIASSGLGVNPQIEGNAIRLSIPPLTQERREEIVKTVKICAENARIAVRNIRRKYIDEIKKNYKDKIIAEDDKDSITEKVQKITDKIIEKINAISTEKENEILNI